MPSEHSPDETTQLLQPPRKHEPSSLRSRPAHRAVTDLENGSIYSGSIDSRLSKEERALGHSSIGERLPYNDYTTIDALHDLVKDSFRLRLLKSTKGFRGKLIAIFDAASGWVAAALIGVLTACVAFLVDIAAATVSDLKTGYCSSNFLSSKEFCCSSKSPFVAPIYSSSSFIPWIHGSRDDFVPLGAGGPVDYCEDWIVWGTDYTARFGIYTGFALAFGMVSGGVTLLTRRTLPAAVADHAKRSPEGETPDHEVNRQAPNHDNDRAAGLDNAENPQPVTIAGKTMYMAAGSGIPEIKTILSGFVIPNFLDLRVLVVKAVGSVFAVSTGMCLGKEGPFVHISTCVAYLVGSLIPKYRENGRKMRELLSTGCASGLSVAFGAPIGGVLFSYEEISTYFPRKVLWRAFLCSLVAAITLRQLNPTGTGKLVLFETNYATTYAPQHYAMFVLLGIAGGIFGGTFCKLNFLWSRTFRQLSVIKGHPMVEIFFVVLLTALLQFPNSVTREPGDVVIKNLLVNCDGGESAEAWVCKHEMAGGGTAYIGWLVYGTLVKLVLTTITFGIKVPSGIIIPALDGGAFFGRLMGQFVTTISPGIFAMVGAVAFLAGVSRMTISLAVIMFELTGELEYVVPEMVGILTAKVVADWLEPEGVYDLAQTVLGHPFLDGEHALKIAQRTGDTVEQLIPPARTMREITVNVPNTGIVDKNVLHEKLNLLKRRGLLDAGLVLVRDGLLLGYLSEAELEGGLAELELSAGRRGVRVMPESNDVEAEHEDLVAFVDKTPLTIARSAPMEIAVEMFSKLGLRYICIIDERNGKLCGVVIKKRLLDWLHRHKS